MGTRPRPLRARLGLFHREWFDQGPPCDGQLSRRITAVASARCARGAHPTIQMYKRGKRDMNGHRLPDGLRDNRKLRGTIITPMTKAEQGDHDAPLSGEEILARKLL